MRTLIDIVAGFAILANAVIHGTDVFAAIILGPALAAVDDLTPSPAHPATFLHIHPRSRKDLAMPPVDFPALPLPPDDTRRTLTLADPDDLGLTHVGVAGGTYTFLVTGKQTAGKYALIDMLIPAGGGPPPHRHDFEEMFHVLEGEFEVVVRDQSRLATVGQSVNIPALAPHRFRNVSSGEGRLLCLVSPSGLEEFFLGVGDLLPNRTASAPQLSEAELKERLARSASLSARYRIENL